MFLVRETVGLPLLEEGNSPFQKKCTTNFNTFFSWIGSFFYFNIFCSWIGSFYLVLVFFLAVGRNLLASFCNLGKDGCICESQVIWKHMTSSAPHLHWLWFLTFLREPQVIQILRFLRFFLLDTTIAYMNNQLGHRVKR